MGIYLAFGVATVAYGQEDAESVSSLADIYSSAHPVKVNGITETCHGYVVINSNGRVTAYEQNGEGPDSIDTGCYMLASGTATHASLQSHTLTLGTTPQGAAADVTQAGDNDMFAILAAGDGSGTRVWSVHTARTNNTVTVVGTLNVVHTDYRATYSLGFRALAHPTADELRDKLCPGRG